ncbi:CopG protein [hydrothermal vent metagenome]|uniref:CopG protein n=1 Tax=hydrothermal vent metagenome TaxID=652676 RepID=A0A3B0VFN3_9ZZZZ
MIFNKNKTKQLMLALLVLLATACSATNNEPATSPEVTKTDSKKIVLQVHKSPTCGCCQKWMDHMDVSGFQTIGRDSETMESVKNAKGVPANYRSCHTATTDDGYVFEGHIPAKFVQQFLNEKPKGAIGLVVPGMPVGSPGMEYQNKFSAYDILLMMKDGTVAKYARVNTLEEQF